MLGTAFAAAAAMLPFAIPIVRIFAVALLTRLALVPIGAGKQRRSGLEDEAKRQRLNELRALVPQPPSKNIGGESIGDEDYLRFLFVCKWDVGKAADMLRTDFEWRTKTKPRTIKYAGAVIGIRGWRRLERRTPSLQMPCTLVTTSEWKPSTFSKLRWRSVAENSRFITFFMEEMCRCMPSKHGVTGAVMLLNMKGFRMPLLVPYVKDGVSLCQKFYPCRLGAVVAFNLPAYFPLIWRVASPWFNEDIRSKIVFPPRHLRNESAVLAWLDQREGRREKPFAQAYSQVGEFASV